ncbi:MAG: hypothetical protein BJ554DRAFT_2905 [Olpidium bornovanus]|uniref:RRM domain-containing protein n=1 Tax=Olpidium bornovanus TaxID=278681 RepID=A0A8H7ZPR2_9FUNG|nr:MAG: hypothetical protein BJ554DRAFT_2905 [Olpidium bornovanus]
MRAHFSKWGEVLDCSVMKEPVTFKSRGFGFLTYANPDVVPSMLAAEHVLDGKRVDPKRAIPREEQVLTEKIFVGGISPDVSEEELTAFFNQFGKVIDTTLMVDRDTGRPRGFGFVTFENDAMVEELAARRDLTIKGKTVCSERAMPKHKALQAKQAREMSNPTYGGGAGSSTIPTFVSDSRTSSAVAKLGVPENVPTGRPAYAAGNPAAAAMYGGPGGVMGMSGTAGAAAAKSWMAQMYGAAANAAAASSSSPVAPAPGAAAAFYGFPGAAAAAYQGIYNPAALMAYYQRMAASGFNWQAAAAAAAAAAATTSGRPGGGWFPGSASTPMRLRVPFWPCVKTELFRLLL